MKTRLASLFLFVLSTPLVLCSCAAGSTAPPGSAGGAGDGDGGAGLDPSTDDGGDPGDAGSSSPPWSSGPSPQPATLDASSPDAPDAEAGAPEGGAPPRGACVAPLGPGVLAIDELMIESVKGTGDYGQWIEIESTAACWVSLAGLHGECPNGDKVRTFDVPADQWLPPHGTIVVADSADPAIDHYLPGTLLTWFGQPRDVLRHLGGTITLTLGGTLVDTVTWPALTLVVGASIAFPASCPLSRRSDWTAWQVSTASWFPGFLGTPNAPNDDVSCP